MLRLQRHQRILEPAQRCLIPALPVVNSVAQPLEQRLAGIALEDRQRFSSPLGKKKAFFPTPIRPLSRFYSHSSPLIENLRILNQNEICCESIFRTVPEQFQRRVRCVSLVASGSCRI